MIRKHKLTKLNSSKYWFVLLTIQLNISKLHTVELSNSSILNNSILYESITLNDFKYCNVSLSKQLNISHLLTHN